MYAAARTYAAGAASRAQASALAADASRITPRAGGQSVSVNMRGTLTPDVHPDISTGAGLFDAQTGTVYIGPSSGHMALSRNAGLEAIPMDQLTGLEIVTQGNNVFWRARSGWFDRPLAAAEQEAINSALASQFGGTAAYTPDMRVIRPGAPGS